jgi:uncharacterized protein (TIGR02452 family)
MTATGGEAMKDPREVSRQDAAAMGAEAVEICRAGGYRAPSGARVEIGEALARARAGTTSWPPDAEVPAPPRGRLATRFAVAHATTLAATRRLVDEGLAPAALNFASARHPGGGFLGGARAQEESLCRASGLHTCLSGRPMYAHHSRVRDPMYSDWVLHSPEVPVFRGDDGALLERPWTAGFLTAAAPQAKALPPARRAELPAAYAGRISRVLAVAAATGHDAVVLGAWGCGAFGGDAEVVAEQFRLALHGPFRGVFAAVVFAVLDTSPEQRFIGPFARKFSVG